MSETAWTPGPWNLSPDYPNPTPDNPHMDCQTFVGDGDREIYVEAVGADRKLIALAPEMAEAILSAERTWDASMIEPVARKLKAIKEQA